MFVAKGKAGLWQEEEVEEVPLRRLSVECLCEASGSLGEEAGLYRVHTLVEGLDVVVREQRLEVFVRRPERAVSRVDIR